MRSALPFLLATVWIASGPAPLRAEEPHQPVPPQAEADGAPEVGDEFEEAVPSPWRWPHFFDDSPGFEQGCPYRGRKLDLIV
jgi:hypothetical protein